MHISRICQSPQMRVSQRVWDFAYAPRVRVHYFYSVCLSIPFCLQSMVTLKEGNDQRQMWEFIRI